MKERPIIFNTEMVGAILEGRKTQTRRVITKIGQYKELVAEGKIISVQSYLNEHPEAGISLSNCPYGEHGERLWIRETWAAIWPDMEDVPLEDCRIEYRADSPRDKYPGGWPEEEAKGNLDAPKWRPSIHMPRWASRLTLEISGIRVERIQEICHEDVIAEGITDRDAFEAVKTRDWPDADLAAFSLLWDSINEKRGYGWDENPWVWVIDFRRINDG